ncbi:MAG: accessory Sec system protein Asp3, partial [Eubacteriales bacterium]|nr:accessory Sec system protein Asp3 [Eubacteriales bacterium]
MVGESWKIRWNEYSSDTYLYGSKITFHTRDDVEFRNLLMPPGTIIKQWYSKTNYQMQRIEPSLP